MNIFCKYRLHIYSMGNRLSGYLIGYEEIVFLFEFFKIRNKWEEAFPEH
jgi:hypothetical protein